MVTFTQQVDRIQANDQTAQYVDGRRLEDYKGYSQAAAEFEHAAYKRYKYSLDAEERSRAEAKANKEAADKQAKIDLTNKYADEVSKIRSKYTQGGSSRQQMEIELRHLTDQYQQYNILTANELYKTQNAVVGVSMTGKLMDADFDRAKRSEEMREKELARQVERNETVRNNQIDAFRSENAFAKNFSDDQVLSAMTQTELLAGQYSTALESVRRSTAAGQALTKSQETMIAQPAQGVSNIAALNSLYAIQDQFGDLTQIDAKKAELIYQNIRDNLIGQGVPAAIAQTSARRSMELLGTDVAVQDRQKYVDSVATVTAQNAALDPGWVGLVSRFGMKNPYLLSYLANNAQLAPEIARAFAVYKENMDKQNEVPEPVKQNPAAFYEAGKDDPKYGDAVSNMVMDKQIEDLKKQDASDSEKKITLNNMGKVAEDWALSKGRRSVKENDQLSKKAALAIGSALAGLSDIYKSSIRFDPHTRQFIITDESGNTAENRHTVSQINKVVRGLKDLSSTQDNATDRLEQVSGVTGIKTATAEDIKNKKALYTKTDAAVEVVKDTATPVMSLFVGAGQAVTGDFKGAMETWGEGADVFYEGMNTAVTGVVGAASEGYEKGKELLKSWGVLTDVYDALKEGTESIENKNYLDMADARMMEELTKDSDIDLSESPQPSLGTTYEQVWNKKGSNWEESLADYTNKVLGFLGVK